MWNPFKKKDPLEGQRANYSLAFDIVPKVLNAFDTGNIPLTELENVSTFMNFADDSKKYLTTMLSNPPAETADMWSSRIELLDYEPVETL